MHDDGQNELILDMHAIVEGDVQGVGFRALTLKYARQLGVSGHVRNLSNGNVEIHAQGNRHKLEKLLDLLKQKLGDGINDISMTFVPYSAVLKEFHIII